MYFCTQKFLAPLARGALARNSQSLETNLCKEEEMARKPIADKEELLVHLVTIRVSGATLKRLEKILSESSCRSIGEVARKILNNERINCFYRDASMSGPMEELALIRKELKSIGININQQTRYFNAVKSDGEKAFHSDRTLDLLVKADAKMERLFALISKLAEKWLPRS